MAFRMEGFAFALALALCLAGADACAQSDEAPGPPACAAPTLARFQQEVTGLAGPHRPAEARQLVHDFLCSPVSAALPIFIKASAPPVTMRIADPANNEDSVVKDIAGELRRSLPAGQAWSPQARLEKRDLVVYYSINQTCWNFFGLRFVDGRWRLVLLGGGCD